MTHAEILRDCLILIKAKLEVDGDFLEPDELKKLKALQYKTFHWWLAEEHKEYTAEIKSFLDYMDSVFPDEDEKIHNIDAFYDMDFTITFGEKTITLHNGSDTYSDIKCLLNREYEDYTEE